MNSSFDDSELLKYALENGMIDLDAIRNDKEMNEREKYLSMHPYQIWLAKDGYYKTYLIDDEGKRIQKRRKNKRELENLIIAIIKDSEEKYTIEKAFHEWNDRNLDLGKISQSTHLRNEQVYRRHYSEFGKKELASVSPEQFEDFLESEVYKKKLKAKAYSSLKGITRGFLKRAKKNKYIFYNVEEMLDGTEITSWDFGRTYRDDEDEVFTEEEYPVIIRYLTEHIDIYNLAILMMFVTGCRIGEIVALKYEDFESNSGNYIFTVKRTETHYGSGKESTYTVKDFPKTPAGYRKVIIPSDYAWIYKELRKINPFSEFVFMKNEKRMNTTQIRSRLKTVCKKLGIKSKSPHKIRKTYGSILIDAGISSKIVIDQMGHTDIAMTERYYHKQRKNLESKRTIIDNVAEFKAL